MKSPYLAASLLAADPGRLADEVTGMTAAGIDLFHWDVMDGHFVPNLAYSPAIIKALRSKTKKPFDVHLMVTDPAQWIDPFIDAGADSIEFHIEAVANPLPLIEKIRNKNVKTGLAINPQTPVSAISDALLKQIDRVIIMTVNPGFGGQAYIDQSEKIRTLSQRFPQLDIMVDGGVNLEVAQTVYQAGATTLVSGNALFKSDREKFIAHIKSLTA